LIKWFFFSICYFFYFDFDPLFTAIFCFEFFFYIIEGFFFNFIIYRDFFR
jgi:hypothetical protein